MKKIGRASEQNRQCPSQAQPAFDHTLHTAGNGNLGGLGSRVRSGTSLQTNSLVPF